MRAFFRKIFPAFYANIHKAPARATVQKQIPPQRRDHPEIARAGSVVSGSADIAIAHPGTCENNNKSTSLSLSLRPSEGIPLQQQRQQLFTRCRIYAVHSKSSPRGRGGGGATQIDIGMRVSRIAVPAQLRYRALQPGLLSGYLSPRSGGSSPRSDVPPRLLLTISTISPPPLPPLFRYPSTCASMHAVAHTRQRGGHVSIKLVFFSLFGLSGDDVLWHCVHYLSARVKLLAGRATTERARARALLLLMYTRLPLAYGNFSAARSRAMDFNPPRVCACVWMRARLRLVCLDNKFTLSAACADTFGLRAGMCIEELRWGALITGGLGKMCAFCTRLAHAR